MHNASLRAIALQNKAGYQPRNGYSIYLNEGWRAQPPALAKNSCGCFLPDLTRFTTLQCGEARHEKQKWRASSPIKGDKSNVKLGLKVTF